MAEQWGQNDGCKLDMSLRLHSSSCPYRSACVQPAQLVAQNRAQVPVAPEFETPSRKKALATMPLRRESPSYGLQFVLMDWFSLLQAELRLRLVDRCSQLHQILAHSYSMPN